MAIEKHVELSYPGVGDNPTHIVLGLEHVRAADSIRMSYDFERDGWVIEQASKFEWPIRAPSSGARCGVASCFAGVAT
jgi:hypothetical protein